jgi:Autotransporter beta-domain
MRLQNIKLKVLVIFFVLSATSPFAYANLPDDFAGTYSGSVPYSETSCSPPPDESETVSLTLTITKVSTNNFHGDGTLIFTDGDIDDLGIDFTGITPTSFSFNWDDNGINNPFQASGTGSGSVTSSGITISGTGVEIGGSTCNITFSGTLNKTSTTLITPDVTPSSTVTDAILFNTQIQSTISDISSHIGGALHGIGFFGGPRVTNNQFKIEGATGLNAGDGSSLSYGVWGNYSYSDYENDLSSTAFDGTNHGFLGGIDFSFWGDSILGVAFGYDKGDIDTTFNGGNQDTDSYTIAPYFGALLTESLSLDFNIGYSRVEYDQFRILTGTQISSSPDADRWFGALNLNGVTYYNNWILGGRLGALYATSVIDSYTESNGTVVAKSKNKSSTLSIAGDVAYSFQNYEPFLNVSYQRDLSLRKISVTTGPQPSNDNDDILLKAGVRYFNKNGISGNFEYTKRFERDDFDEDRISLTIRADF